ncbi:MAG: LysE family transporter [Ruminococcus sp.]|nr:LysE family transporter [Ruminococcus sp.]
MIYLIKGLLIGLIFGVPVGAVGTLCVSRSLQYGVKSGIVTGFGASTAELFYSIVGAFGITAVSGFLDRHSIVINILGGALVITMGVMTILKAPKQQEDKPKTGYAVMFLSAFAVCITNPAAVITYLFAFSYFGINGTLSAANGALFVIGIVAGTQIWWITLSFLSQLIKKKAGEKGFVIMNRLFGLIMIGFGAAVYIKVIKELF